MRHERSAELFMAKLFMALRSLAAALTCHKKLAT
jgi:hypothetical protein